jgi:hypothetical protein
MGAVKAGGDRQHLHEVIRELSMEAVCEILLLILGNASQEIWKG